MGFSCSAMILFYPKDPAVVKIVRRSKFTSRMVNLLRRSDLLWRPPLRRHYFPGFCRHFSPQRGFHIVVNMGGGVVETLRRSNSLSRSIFGTAGSFSTLKLASP